MTKNNKTINRIGSLLCDKTTGVLARRKLLSNEIEEFGSLVTLTYLQRKIFPLLDELKK